MLKVGAGSRSALVGEGGAGGGGEAGRWQVHEAASAARASTGARARPGRDREGVGMRWSWIAVTAAFQGYRRPGRAEWFKSLRAWCPGCPAVDLRDGPRGLRHRRAQLSDGHQPGLMEAAGRP